MGLQNLRDLALLPPWPETSSHQNACEFTLVQALLPDPGASTAIGARSLVNRASQLSDLTSQVPFSVKLSIDCQLSLSCGSHGDCDAEKGVHELSFKGDVERARLDTFHSKVSEILCIFWKNPPVCKWAVGSPKAQRKEMSRVWWRAEALASPVGAPAC